jgi:hypothetical protein
LHQDLLPYDLYDYKRYSSENYQTTKISFGKKLFLCSMKKLRHLIMGLAGLFLFAACQKELSFENPFPDVFASGSLQSLAGDCAPIVTNGVYKQDSTLGDSNYVVVQARITSPGKYIISSDTQNGFSFRDSNYVTDTGLHTFTLKATGRPTLTQTTNFIVSFDSTTCFFSIPVIGNVAAVYALEGAPMACSNADVQGTYEEGTALALANKVVLQVNVTTPGSYTINTGTNEGMSFSASGNFASTGLQTVTLQGSGTAPLAGTYTIPVIAGSSNCSFEITVSGSGGEITDPNISDSAWSFTESTNSYNGAFFDVFDTTRTDLGYGLVFLGYTPTSFDTVLQMGVLLPSSDIQPGTYNTNTLAAFYYQDYSDTSNIVDIYKAQPGSVGANIQITIASYDPATRIITGTFSGTALSTSGPTVPITLGRFRAKVR